MEESKADIIAAAIGLKATLKLCAHFGGKTLYVPTVIAFDHPISLLIGHDKAQKLAEAIGGEEVTLPTVDISYERRVARVIRFLIYGSSHGRLPPWKASLSAPSLVLPKSTAS